MANQQAASAGGKVHGGVTRQVFINFMGGLLVTATAGSAGFFKLAEPSELKSCTDSRVSVFEPRISAANKTDVSIEGDVLKAEQVFAPGEVTMTLDWLWNYKIDGLKDRDGRHYEAYFDANFFSGITKRGALYVNGHSVGHGKLVFGKEIIFLCTLNDGEFIDLVLLEPLQWSDRRREEVGDNPVDSAVLEHSKPPIALHYSRTKSSPLDPVSFEANGIVDLDIDIALFGERRLNENDESFVVRIGDMVRCKSRFECIGDRLTLYVPNLGGVWLQINPSTFGRESAAHGPLYNQEKLIGYFHAANTGGDIDLTCYGVDDRHNVILRARCPALKKSG
ncbi:hypothetical protein [Planctomycetes bacterium K23_9]|uniref:Uncharacterized protein n=1 Tax=Stieleria marina TaxID=1930275 RepID=A0A517NNL1_9BACT|nr:hypothetical protein K239x_06430 [Planctomycetes bacterium K23_9]